VETVADSSRWGETSIRSIAVLPLINETKDKDPNAEYLCDILTESLVNSLSLLPGVQIKACSVVLHYKGRDVQEAGRELGVEAVLVGRVLQFYKKTFIRMELVDVENGWQVWGEEYNEKISDMHKLQGTVTKGVSEKMRLKFKGEQQHRIFRPLSY